jgi:hypothetical protein
MLLLSQKTIIPILLAINHQPIHQHHQLTHHITFPETPLETGIHRIHSPLRIFRSIGGSLYLIPNSTSTPVRTSASSVLIAFDVRTIEGNRWNARMISNERSVCDIFFMDSETLQRKAMLKMRVAPFNAGGHSIAASLTLFDFDVLKFSCALFVAAISSSYWSDCTRSRSVMVKRKCELNLHRLYRRMVVHGVNFQTMKGV